MPAPLQIALRAGQLLFAVITLALVGNVVDEAFAGNSSSINFALFVSILDFVFVLYGIAAIFFESLAFGFVGPSIDAVLAIFTFIAGTVLAAKLGVHSCGNQVIISPSLDNRALIANDVQKSYIRSNPLTNGSNNPGKRCHELQAATAFYWFALPLFVTSAALAFMGSGSSFKGRGGIRRGGPSMSQV
ncbi:hypothetical protein B2J93_8520 [Marssonina coronariae]|uniref:MARVEL domain-containing protein n=1 Tax=Diplocarpon coronariae TaxID=2795749 RepID=A0A218ZDP9_9HELO|nr:hypothetical protein B2J93_8520 [Marssonina coronariae]